MQKVFKVDFDDWFQCQSGVLAKWKTGGHWKTQKMSTRSTSGAIVVTSISTSGPQEIWNAIQDLRSFLRPFGTLAHGAVITASFIVIISSSRFTSVVKGISDASCREPDFCEFSFLVVGLQSNLSQVAASAALASASLVTHWKFQRSQQIKREVWIVIIIIMKSHCIFSPQKQKGQSGGRTVETPALRQLSGQKRASASIRCSQFSLSLICCLWLFSAVYFQMISQNATTISSTLPTQIKRRRLIRSSASLNSQQNHLSSTGSTLVFLFTNCILTEWTAWLKI